MIQHEIDLKLKTMSDSEDDYMSFKVSLDSKDDVRPSLTFNNREKRKLEIFKKKQEASNKRQKSLVEIERETRDKGLKTAISNENKGFKLLEKMGFKPGESLGKSKSGIKEPIDIVYKQGTSGMGTESHLKKVISERQQRKIQNLKHHETQFRLHNKEKKNMSQLRKDFFKAQKICEELDFRRNIKDPEEEFFWTRETIKKMRKMIKKESKEDTDSSDEDEDEEFETYVTEENLLMIIDYLRSTHLYCIFCVITGVDKEDLKENCPGPYRVDHEDELE